MNAKAEAFVRLEETVSALRGPGGCPWDRAQKLPDVSRYLIEEASEVADAIDEAQGRPLASVMEELGDLLMNILLASRIAEDEGAFDVAEVADAIREKLIRRHPHVFGVEGKPAVPLSGVSEVLTTWNAIKAQEEKARKPAGTGRPPSRLDGVPRSLPPLDRAFELGRKAAKAGFDWPDASGAFEKVREELDEVRRQMDLHSAAPGAAGPALAEELGDLLFAAVNLCRKLEVRPEAALRGTLRKFCERFHAIEERYPEMERASLEEMESVWQEAKGRLARGSEKEN
jgi:tetrapyrrole methylase family protein/MazG family protein/ATP diphosphatase